MTLIEDPTDRLKSRDAGRSKGRAAQAAQRVWRLARLRIGSNIQPEFRIGRNKLGIPLPCPQICDRTESVMAEARVRLKFDGPAVVGHAQENANRAPGQISISCDGAPRASERKQ